MNLVVKIQNQLVFLSKMRYIKLLKEGGGAAKTYVGKKGGSGENLCLPTRGGGTVWPEGKFAKIPKCLFYVLNRYFLTLITT